MLWILLIQLFALSTFAQDEIDFRKARLEMVKYQIAARDISDQATLEAMRKVPRHLFVPEALSPYAYIDQPLPIGNEQTISQPYMVAYMTAAINPGKSYKVLEIGTGSGYQAAVLAEIVDTVYTVEIIESLAEQARERLLRLGYTNIKIKTGDGFAGWMEKGPFDAILVTAAPEEIPQQLIEQLKEGGRMVIPLGKTNMTQQLVLIKKEKNEISTENLMQVRFVPFTRPDSVINQ